MDDPDALEDELFDEFDELDELPLPEELDVVDEPVEELDEPVEELEEGLVGWKKVFPVPNPRFAAFVPPTVIAAVSFLPLMTRWPLLLSHAATCAWP